MTSIAEAAAALLRLLRWGRPDGGSSRPLVLAGEIPAHESGVADERGPRPFHHPAPGGSKRPRQVRTSAPSTAAFPLRKLIRVGVGPERG